MTEIQRHVDQIIAEMTGLVIDSDEAALEAAEFLEKNKETQKLVQNEYAPLKEEAYRPYKRILDEIKRYMDMLTKAEEVVKKKIGAWHAEQTKKKREEEERLRREAEEKLITEAEVTGDAQILDAPVVVKAAEPEKIDGISYVENWTFEITDIADIPREYMMPDEKKIRAVVKALRSDAVIPGVRVYSENTVRVTV